MKNLCLIFTCLLIIQSSISFHHGRPKTGFPDEVIPPLIDLPALLHSVDPDGILEIELNKLPPEELMRQLQDVFNTIIYFQAYYHKLAEAFGALSNRGIY